MVVQGSVLIPSSGACNDGFKAADMVDWKNGTLTAPVAKEKKTRGIISAKPFAGLSIDRTSLEMEEKLLEEKLAAVRAMLKVY